MTAEAAALSLYLLFPPISAEHRAFARFLGQSDFASMESAESRKNLFEYLNSEVMKEAVAEKDSAEVEPSAVSESSAVEELAPEENQRTTFLKSIPSDEKYIPDSKGNLKWFMVGEEQFGTGPEGSGKMYLAESNRDCYIKKDYDSEFRMTEYTVRKRSSSLADLMSEDSLLFSKKWRYGEKHSTLETDWKAGTETETFFNGKKKPVYVAEFSLLDDPESTGEKKLPKIRVRKTEKNLSYDQEGRILTDEEKFYTKNGARVYYTKKSVYRYTAKSESPDTEFYEDGMLRFSREYDSDDSWTERTFFDDKFVVTNRFRNGEKVDEVISPLKKQR